MRKNMIMLPAKHETSIGFCGNSQHSVVQHTMELLAEDLAGKSGLKAFIFVSCAV